MIKSCLSVVYYISTAQFYPSYNQFIICFRLIFGWTFLAAISASRNFFSGQKFGS